MKNFIFTILIGLLVCSIASGQKEYAVNKSSGTLSINGINKLDIQGYDGSSIVFINNKHDDEEQDIKDGLRKISPLGINDNSGIGLSVAEDGDEIIVEHTSNVANGSCGDAGDEYTIKVPRNMNLYITHTTLYGDDIKINDMRGEIEISAYHSDLQLNNVTGPLAVKTVYGHVNTKFGTVNQSSAISLVSVYGHVDVTMPANTKADLRVITNYGTLYSDMDINLIANTKESREEMRSINTKKINGTLNGGGVEITISAMQDDIYLRSM